MIVTIRKGKESSFYFDGKFYDTGVPLSLNFSEAMRLSRVCQLDATWEQTIYDPSLFKERHFFNFIGDVENQSGFGGVSYALVKNSIPKYEVSLVGNTIKVRDPDISSAIRRDVLQAGAAVWHDQPRELWLYTPFKRNIAITPFETTVIPHSWIGKMNGFDALYVPCKQNIEAFRESGVKVPIELIHWGIDPTMFYPLPRTNDRPFTFGTMGVLTERKGTDVLLAAFREAFSPNESVRLICKNSSPAWMFGGVDSRVRVQNGLTGQDELRSDFFSQIDCFVFPTRGEGFGLTPLEAMATGVPAIVTGWAGPAEYMTPEVGWSLDYTMTPAKVFSEIVYKEECGNWAEPSKEHLIHLMRHAYEHQNEVREKGAAAAKYVQENWLWKDKIKMFHGALEKTLA